MRKVMPNLWPSCVERMTLRPIEVWLDADFLVQVFEVPFCAGHRRLTVCRAAGVAMDGRGRPVYRDGITWDDLQMVKAACGYAESWAVEVFPADSETVNVANMRHLWVLPEAPAFAWRKP